MYVKGVRWKVIEKVQYVVDKDWKRVKPIPGQEQSQFSVVAEEKVLQICVERNGYEVWEDVPEYEDE